MSFSILGLFRTVAVIALLGFLSACAEHVRSDPAIVAARTYKSDEPPYVELITMVNKENERGAHSALIINASERVIWDPAGTFQHPELAEVEDLHHGATDRLVSYYKRYHARFSHYVRVQHLDLTPAEAERMLQSARNHGAVPKMFCTMSTAQVLKSVPEFANVPESMFPERLRRAVAEIPGIVDSYVDEEDIGQNVPTD
jgi:hypothetical protein